MIARRTFVQTYLSSLVLLVLTTNPAPLFAQAGIAGTWASLYHEDAPERQPGPELGDYMGLPINDAARLRAESWDAAMLSVLEHQCKPHPGPYLLRGPSDMEVWRDVDLSTQDVIAYHMVIEWLTPTRTIWMDGRPHPSPNARHTWQGFSTGSWENGALVVRTTHLKAGYLRRNGVPHSDQATMVEYFRRFGDRLNYVSIVDDPVYLTEPLVKSTDWVLRPANTMPAMSCRPAVEVNVPRDFIPHHLPGTNEPSADLARMLGVPIEDARGGAHTTYPAGVETPSHRQAPLNINAAPADGTNVEVVPVRDNIFMLVTRGANLTAQVGEDGILVVDTSYADLADEIMTELEALSSGVLRFIINTNGDIDHTDGNLALSQKGGSVADRPYGDIANEITGALIAAHENVLLTMAARGAPGFAMPTDAYFRPETDMYFNGEAIKLYHAPNAHSNADTIVHFRASDVVSTGDIFLTTGYPVIDLENGGSINGIINALNHVLELTVPAAKQEDGTLVIPGHGRLSDEADVVEYRDMLTTIRDRVRAMIDAGMSLTEVREAQPTLDYDARYGTGSSSAATTQQFVEAVYRSLLD